MNKTRIKKILIPTDFSDTSLKAVAHAVFLANLEKASITIIHVLEKNLRKEGISANSSNYAEYAGAMEILGQKNSILEERWEEHATTLLNHLVNKITKEGVKDVECIIEQGNVYTVICEQAKKISADIIVMGTHGIKGFREFTVGSNTYNVVKHAECAVLSIQKKTTIVTFSNILIPFTDRTHSRESVDYAIHMAKDYGATLHILGIDTEKAELHFEKIQKEAEQIKKMAHKAGLACTIKVMPASHISPLLLKYAKHVSADLMVLVSDMDKLSLSEYFTGPVIKQIVNHSPIPVISIKPKIAYYEPDEVHYNPVSF